VLDRVNHGRDRVLRKRHVRANQTMKLCRICEKPKSFTEFNRQPTSKDGRKNVCKECDSRLKREQRQQAKQHETPIDR
jgi:superfamily II helicase